MEFYKEIRSENYIGYVFNNDVNMYSAAYHIIKKGQYNNFVKGYFLKQDGKEKMFINTSELKSLLHMVNVIDANALMYLLGKAIAFIYWVKYSSFIHLDSIVFEPADLYIDVNMNDIKFICLPISINERERDCTVAEKQFVYMISCVLYYANCFENRNCKLLYMDCQTGYYLLDDLYRNLCNGRYGEMKILSVDEIERKKNTVNFCVLKPQDQFREDMIVDKATYIIGKKKEIVDYCINEDGVSRQHCKITINGMDILLEDMNSTNGTLVNGVRIFPEQHIPLQQGDCVTIATVTYEVQ